MKLFATGWRSVWRRAVALAVPATGQFGAQSLMRTIDLVITAGISPAAVVALGLSDLLMSLADRVSNGYVSGANTLVSQDTGAVAGANRDQALTQASVLAAGVTVPFVVVFVLFGGVLLRLIGAGEAAVDLGVTYLTVVAATAPLVALREVAGNGLRAIGDTKTPAYVTVPMDGVNAALSVTFGLGWFGAPRFGILGIGAATLVASAAGTILLCGYVQYASPLSYTVPRGRTVAAQLTRLAAPSAATGFVTTFAVFPFNGLLLSVGTVVNAGYQLGWRLFSQLVGPISRGLGVAGRTLIGQRLGENAADGSADDGMRPADLVGSVLVLTALVGVTGGGVTALIAPVVTGLVAEDPAVARQGAAFLAFFGAISVVFVTNNVATAMLGGASEARLPLVSRLVGTYGGMVGVTWIFLRADYGVTSFYVGLTCCYLLMLAVVAGGFWRLNWVGRATGWIADRGSIDSD